jgi:hypothetical protein
MISQNSRPQNDVNKLASSRAVLGTKYNSRNTRAQGCRRAGTSTTTTATSHSPRSTDARLPTPSNSQWLATERAALWAPVKRWGGKSNSSRPVSHHFFQFDQKSQGRVGGDRSRPPGAVTQLRGDHQFDHSPLGTVRDPFLPTGDHAIQRESRWFPPFVTAVELGAVGQPTPIMSLDLV